MSRVKCKEIDSLCVKLLDRSIKSTWRFYMDIKLIIYGHKFSLDAISLEEYLDRNGIAYEWRDIEDGDPDFKDELSLLAR